MRNDLLYQLIEVLTILPGIGKKSAQRMALYLIDKNKDGAKLMANSILEAVENIKRCQRCRMLTSEDFCNICSDKNRDKKSICVVEHISDVLAIESTGGYRGTYFVLLGRLSPMDGIGPDELGIKDLIKIIHNEDKQSPFSDDILVNKLDQEGYTLARRTVAKYRDQMGYPVARLRKEI